MIRLVRRIDAVDTDEGVHTCSMLKELRINDVSFIARSVFSPASALTFTTNIYIHSNTAPLYTNI